jgi:UDP-2-acetamido-2,6-beta-L-arabino-hexul-4-ose reductase
VNERIVVTGGEGFLGWHVRVLARALGRPDPAILGRGDLDQPDRLAVTVDGADRVVHLAGVNRGPDDDVVAGNVAPARALAQALRRCDAPPKSVVFANSIQAGNPTPYGEAKATAAGILAEAAGWTGSDFADLRLPNLFGEHGRPHYNSVVATFCRVLADGGTPSVDGDRELDLLHATDAAAALLGVAAPEPVTRCSVARIADRLASFARVYRAGEIPDLADRFDVRLFNTYRSHCFPEHYPIPLPRRSDARGELVETVKVHGGGGQTFCSSTVPGATRGEHYHLAKVERFVVLRGRAEIKLRRLLHPDVVTFRVDGDSPVAVDMPTMWVHSIVNVDDGELLTLFWSNELFDPDRPDTYPEMVA